MLLFFLLIHQRTKDIVNLLHNLKVKVWIGLTLTQMRNLQSIFDKDRWQNNGQL